MSRLLDAAKSAARAVSALVAAPEVLSFRIRAVVLGRDRALQASSQLLSLVPGLAGQYLRRAFYARALERFHPSATVEFGALFSKAAARVDENVYVGPRCHLGWVHLERDVLLAPGVQIPSGPAIHGTRNPTVPIREQPGELRRVRIGAGSWIGSGAVVLADVGAHCVVAAGAVVVRPIPDHVVAGGVPATVLRRRLEERREGGAA